MKQVSIRLNTSNADVIDIKEYLSGYDDAVSIYNGDYTADWLLSDIHGEKWIIKTSKTSKTSKINSSINQPEYKYTKSIYWNRVMPDGTSLCDLGNKTVLEFYQKALFILVESTTIMPNASISSLNSLMRSLFTLIPWTFREDMQLSSKSNILKNLTQKRLESLVFDYVAGGAFSVTDCAGLIIRRFNQLTNNKIKDTKKFNFTSSEKTLFISFFKDRKLYTQNTQGNEFIDRKKFLNLFSLCHSHSYNDHFTLFLRQFEPDYINQNPDVLLPKKLEYELPGHTTPLIKDIQNNPSNFISVNSLIRFTSDILKLKPLFPDYLPSSESFKFDKLHSYARKHGASNNLTPWIPLPIALKALNKAISLVINKGDLIIDCIEDLYEYLLKENLLLTNNLSRNKNDRRNGLIKKILSKKEYETIGVNQFYTNASLGREGKTYAYLLRNETNLYHYIKLLKAACFIVIAGLKPIRVNEISTLKYDCLYFKDEDGYWLIQEIEKSGIQEILPEDAKPIPHIAARAISLLKRFSNHANLICPSPTESEYLLYSLNYGTNNLIASIDSAEIIRDCLSVFCDYYEMPTDEYGRRWYINIHELRKSFLLTFFWTFKFSSLDACRWIAGHSDSEHVFQYIEANIPGEEMVEVEAEYASQQLRLFSSNQKLSDIENIEELNHDVCNHFSVKCVTEIAEQELQQWLSYAITSGKYEIYVYGIEATNILQSANIAVKII